MNIPGLHESFAEQKSTHQVIYKSDVLVRCGLRGEVDEVDVWMKTHDVSRRYCRESAKQRHSARDPRIIYHYLPNSAIYPNINYHYLISKVNAIADNESFLIGDGNVSSQVSDIRMNSSFILILSIVYAEARSEENEWVGKYLYGCCTAMRFSAQSFVSLHYGTQKNSPIPKIPQRETKGALRSLRMNGGAAFRKLPGVQL
jgi:hypothetical protein